MMDTQMMGKTGQILTLCPTASRYSYAGAAAGARSAMAAAGSRVSTGGLCVPHASFKQSLFPCREIQFRSLDCSAK